MPGSDASAIVVEARACIRLSVPLAASQLAQVGMALSGTLTAAHLGARSVAAYALAWSLYSTVLLLGVGLLSAVGPLAAHAFGAGDLRQISRIGRHGLVVALGVSIPSIALLLQASPLLLALQQDPSVVALATDYLHAAIWGLPPALAFASLRHIVGAVCRPKIIFTIMLWAMCLTALFNILVVPGFGIAAIAWGGAAVQWTMLAALVAFTLGNRAFEEITLFSGQDSPLRWGLIREILAVGWPIGLTFALESGLFTAGAFLVGTFGSDALAAHQVAAQTVYVTFMIPSGIGHAAAYRVGHWLGARNREGARRAAHVALGLGAAVGVVMAIVLYASAGAITALFIDPLDPANRGSAALAVSLLRVAAVFQIADGLQGIAGGTLRGLKDTRIPLLMAFVTYGACGVGAAWLLGFAGSRGPVGVWWGLGVGLACTAAVFAWRFERRVSGPSPLGR